MAATPLPYSALAPAGEGSKLAILPLQVEGGLGGSDQAELMKALVAGLERGSFSIVGPDQVLAADGRAASCDNAGCYKSIAAATGAAYVCLLYTSPSPRD